MNLFAFSCGPHLVSGGRLLCSLCANLRIPVPSSRPQQLTQPHMLPQVLLSQCQLVWQQGYPANQPAGGRIQQVFYCSDENLKKLYTYKNEILERSARQGNRLLPRMTIIHLTASQQFHTLIAPKEKKNKRKLMACASFYICKLRNTTCPFTHKGRWCDTFFQQEMMIQVISQSFMHKWGGTHNKDWTNVICSFIYRCNFRILHWQDLKHSAAMFFWILNVKYASEKQAVIFSQYKIGLNTWRIFKWK